MRKEIEESKGWGKKKESLGNKLRPRDWWLVLSFEAPAMEVVGLIQRWRDQVRREEKERERGLRIMFLLEKKKKKKGDVAGQDWLT